MSKLQILSCFAGIVSGISSICLNSVPLGILGLSLLILVIGKFIFYIIDEVEDFI